ncbi:MAG: hypothetical protein ACYCXW_10190 [Solirubrobacteraceae bacterium]
MGVPTELLEAQWREVDARLARGNLDSGQAVDVLGDAGLVRRVRSFGVMAGLVWVVQPPLGALVPGPRLVFDLGELYGGPRIYRPVRDLMLADTGITSERVPG